MIGRRGILPTIVLLLVPGAPTAQSDESLFPDAVPYVDARGSFILGAPTPLESAPGAHGNVTAARFAFQTDGCFLDFRLRLTWIPGGLSVGSDPNELFLGSAMRVELHSVDEGVLPLASWTGSGGQLVGTTGFPLQNETAHLLRVHYLDGPPANYTLLGLGVRSEDLGCALVNEVEANPAGTDAGHEWIELHNPTDRSLPLGNWLLRSSHGQIEETLLAPDYRLDPGAFSLVPFDRQFLDNDGDSIKLIHPLGTIVDETPWAVDTSNDARTHQRIPDAAGTWGFLTGTPGASNASP